MSEQKIHGHAIGVVTSTAPTTASVFGRYVVLDESGERVAVSFGELPPAPKPARSELDQQASAALRELANAIDAGAVRVVRTEFAHGGAWSMRIDYVPVCYKIDTVMT